MAADSGAGGVGWCSWCTDFFTADGLIREKAVGQLV